MPEPLERLGTIARDAGVAIMARYDRPEVRIKADSSPLTDADLASQQVIQAALERWDPRIPVVSEESAPPPGVRASPVAPLVAGHFLDGTKEFVSRNGEFTVNIALIEADVPVLGVVYAPAFDLLYAGGRRVGSWRTEGTGPAERIWSRPWQTGRPARIVESRSHPSADLERFLASIDVRERAAVGSSLKFCRVAEGAADLYPRFGPMMEWDVAAGDCVFRHSAQSGERHSPLTYNSEDLRVKSFVLGLASASAQAQLLQTA